MLRLQVITFLIFNLEIYYKSFILKSMIEEV